MLLILPLKSGSQMRKIRQAEGDIYLVSISDMFCSNSCLSKIMFTDYRCAGGARKPREVADMWRANRGLQDHWEGGRGVIVIAYLCFALLFHYNNYIINT